MSAAVAAAIAADDAEAAAAEAAEDRRIEDAFTASYIPEDDEAFMAYTPEDIAEAEEASRRAAQSVLAAVAAASATGEPDFAPPAVRAALAALNATM